MIATVQCFASNYGHYPLLKGKLRSAVRDIIYRTQEELRRRRLAREGGERIREIRLLAEREMAGQPLPNERHMAYNNQYNAPVARQNRPREGYSSYRRL